MLVDKTNFGLVLYNHANFYRFEESSNEYQFFSAFHWSTTDTPPASQCIAVQCTISKTLCGPCIAAIAGLNFIQNFKLSTISAEHEIRL